MNEELEQLQEEPTDPSPVPPEPEAKSLDDAISSAFDRVRDEQGRFAKRGDTESAEKAAETSGKPIPTDPEGAGGASGVPPDQDAPQPEQTEPPKGIAYDAPERLSESARKVWHNTPREVRAEISRHMTDMERGLTEYQERFKPLEEFDAMAKQGGTTLHDAMQRYVDMEQLLATDFAAGVQELCRNAGTDLRSLAKWALEQPEAEQFAAPPPPQKPEPDPREEKLTAMEQRLEAIERERVEAQLSAFEREHPRVKELEGVMVQLMNGGLAETLEKAYTMAEQLNPLPSAPAEQPVAPQAPQTRKPSAQITGSPASGVSPVERNQPARTVSEAVDRAFARLS